MLVGGWVGVTGVGGGRLGVCTAKRLFRNIKRKIKENKNVPHDGICV